MAIEKLSAVQQSELIAALMFAFKNYDELRLLTRLELNVPLAEVSGPGPLKTVVLNLVEWAEGEGELETLIGGALRSRPKNPKLRAFSLGLALNASGPPSPALEAIVKPHVPMQDTARWRAQMERLEGSVCRIEMPQDDAAGTGFLIAEDLVLTNCHVAAQMAARGASAADCVARFGYRLAVDGAAEKGEGVPFAGDWQVDSSPVAALDYAVIRLASAPGRPSFPTPTRYDFRPDDIYLILQHPYGVEMKLSAGVYESHDPALNRIRYTANTEPGSSGSPVCSIGWQPVALHHAGDSQRNTGVVLAAVAASGRVPELWKG